MMRRLTNQICTACLLAECLSMSLAARQLQQAQPTNSLQDQLQTKFAELHKEGSFPGGTAGIVLADGRALTMAVGVSDRTAGTAMKPTDRLLLGSVGKTYVSAIALQLVAERRIGLDDPISKYLGQEPWFKRLPNADRITVRQLMRHTSGLVRYELNPKFTADLTANPDREWSPVDRLSYLFDAEAPFAPGEGWEYSDTN